MEETTAAFWLGSYTPGADGSEEGSGVGVRALGRNASGSLVPVAQFEADSPSWVVQHPSLPVVYAAEEFSGLVVALRAAHDGTMTAVGAPVEVGGIVCHLTVAPDGSAVVASCYGDGRVVLLPLEPDGRLTGRTVELPTATDPWADHATVPGLGAGGVLLGAREAAMEAALAAASAALGVAAPADDAVSVGDPLAAAVLAADGAEERQSRAHTSRWLPDGRVVTTDLGVDLVRFWRRGSSASAPLVLDHEVTLPRGVGPRHVAWHESGHLHVLTEYSIEVFTLRAGVDGRYRIVAGVDATSDGAEDGDSAAELTVVGSREHLHASVRGSNRIATLQIRGDGSELRPMGDVDSGGDGPRHHIEDGGVVHVANQRSGTVVTFELDERTAVPAADRERRGRQSHVPDSGTPRIATHRQTTDSVAGNGFHCRLWHSNGLRSIVIVTRGSKRR
jgi:6-phosphogluconolactonase (cycloisomerase 2 family)